MKGKWVAVVGILALLCIRSASAQDLFDGWYWNPNESGWGINVEVQGDTMFIAVFTYRQNGTVVWYYGVSKIDYSDPVFDGNLGLASDGACFTCPYAPPTFDDRAGGRMRIDFNTPTGPRVTWKGRTTSLQRQYWAFATQNDFLFGAWAMIRGIELPFADYYILDGRETSNTGEAFVSGRSTDGSLAVAQWFAADEMYSMLNRKSTADWYYEFVMNKEMMVGHYWILDPGENPIGSGTEFWAFRVGQQEIPQTKAAHDKLQVLELEHYSAHGKQFDAARSFRVQQLIEKANLPRYALRPNFE